MPKSKRPPETRRSRRGLKPGQASVARSTAKEYWQTESLVPRLQRLAQAIAAAPATSHGAELSHEDCQALLEFYVEGEERKEDVRARYPAVWAHLQSCGECRFSYQLLKDSPAPDSVPDQVSASTSAPPLPFLGLSKPGASWNGYKRSRIAGSSLGFGYFVRSSHVERIFGAHPASVLRGDRPPTGRSLLLSDNLTLGKHDITVDVWLLPSKLDGTAKVEVEFAASASLTGPVRVNLACGHLAYQGVIIDGICRFADIPLSEVQARRDWHVGFEIGETVPTAPQADGDASPRA